MTDYNDEISLLIPAYLRRELSPADMAKVEAAAAVDPSVKADLNFQRALRETLQSDQPAASSSELGWARLSRRLDALETEGDQDMVPMPVAANDEPLKRSRFWKYATAALAILVVGQFGFMKHLDANETVDEKYTLVSETNSGSQTSVSPGEAVRLDTLGSVLKSLDGQIISGPSAIGLFDLQFETRTACEAALPQLRDIMESVSNCS